MVNCEISVALNVHSELSNIGDKLVCHKKRSFYFNQFKIEGAGVSRTESRCGIFFSLYVVGITEYRQEKKRHVEGKHVQKGWGLNNGIDMRLKFLYTLIT